MRNSWKHTRVDTTTGIVKSNASVSLLMIFVGVTMQTNIVEKLFASFTDLETAINGAKKTLAAKENIPAEIFNRLNSYDGILEKQRSLAREMCRHMKAGNWEEVNQFVTRINGLSSMIRDDARAILSSIAMNRDNEPDEKINFC